MLKTYLYLPDSLDKKINYSVKTQKISKAEVIRRALERGVDEIQSENFSSALVLKELSKVGKLYKLSGPKNSSARIDELMWDKDWSNNG